MKLNDYEKIESSFIDFKVNLEVDKPKSWLTPYIANKIIDFNGFDNFKSNRLNLIIIRTIVL